MSNKIDNPVVLIHKRDNSDSYTVAITSGSADYRDASLMVTMEPDMTGYAEYWSKTGYYMAAEIELLRRICAEAYQCVGYLSEECGASDDEHVIKLMDNLSQMKLVHEDLLPFQLSDCAPVNDITSDKPLIITLPDTSSKAFWSGSSKNEVFHPDTYKRWVKEAIERDCCIARIEVRVK